jgi:hypothetical protein
MSLHADYRDFLAESGHLDLVRTSFRQTAGNVEAELLASATAFVATGATRGMLAEQYDTLLRGLVKCMQLKSDERVSGRLLGVSITLLIGHIISETTTGWREALHILVERVVDRGGIVRLSGCVGGVGERRVIVERPMLLAAHLDMAVVMELLGRLRDESADI